MTRPHLFEFIDLSWYPASLRDLQTDAIGRMSGPAFDGAAPIIRDTLARTRESRVVDLCSGGGGPWARLRTLLDEGEGTVPITLTDHYPNLPRFVRLREESNGQVDFVPHAVDANAVPVELGGMRTMFNAFHHLRPDEAVSVLRDARDAGVPVAIFDVKSARADASSLVQALVFFALAPILFYLTYFFLTPTLGRLTLPRLLFTYVIPVVPIVTCWDFLVTALRAYTKAELQTMVAGLGREDYVWHVGEIGTKQLPVTYVVGYPRGPVAR